MDYAQLQPLSLSTFQPLAFMLGAGILLGLEGLKKGMEKAGPQREPA